MALSFHDRAVKRASEDISDPTILSRVRFWIGEFDIGRGTAKTWASNNNLRRIKRILDFMLQQYKKTGVVDKTLLSHEEILALRYYSPNGDLSSKVISSLLELDLGDWMSKKGLTGDSRKLDNVDDVGARISAIIASKSFATKESVDAIGKKVERANKVDDDRIKGFMEKQLKPVLTYIHDMETSSQTRVEACQEAIKDRKAEADTEMEKLNSIIARYGAKIAKMEEQYSARISKLEEGVCKRNRNPDTQVSSSSGAIPSAQQVDHYRDGPPLNPGNGQNFQNRGHSYTPAGPKNMNNASWRRPASYAGHSADPQPSNNDYRGHPGPTNGHDLGPEEHLPSSVDCRTDGHRDKKPKT
ncbi:hypothetical protein QBC42DRAFT_284402 [Cladorrhinum samala]|uniref:Uncharacterized protein n=1 Tax=Cladorrhinum samala TaxID=585594 RepID=A0AAV9HWA0_9PEZI|nr:hypothetical protein QBC42DRAFT_284402 [Cladorrhinum samala]